MVRFSPIVAVSLIIIVPSFRLRMWVSGSVREEWTWRCSHLFRVRGERVFLDRCWKRRNWDKVHLGMCMEENLRQKKDIFWVICI